MQNILLSPANVPDLREIVYSRIKDAIVSGQIPAGSRLSEIELSKQLDVSRTPVREAIRQLAETGLVTLSSRRGAYVLLPTPKDIADIYDVRIALECICVRDLCAAPPVIDLEEHRQAFEEVSNDWDAKKFSDMDSSFHVMLSGRSQNMYLKTMLARIGCLMMLCRHYAVGNIPKVLSSHEHIAIIDAILACDVDRAQAEMSLHLGRTRDALIEYIKDHPETASPSE